MNLQGFGLTLGIPSGHGVQGGSNVAYFGEAFDMSVAPRSHKYDRHAEPGSLVLPSFTSVFCPLVVVLNDFLWHQSSTEQKRPEHLTTPSVLPPLYERPLICGLGGGSPTQQLSPPYEVVRRTSARRSPERCCEGFD